MLHCIRQALKPEKSSSLRRGISTNSITHSLCFDNLYTLFHFQPHYRNTVFDHTLHCFDKSLSRYFIRWKTLCENFDFIMFTSVNGVKSLIRTFTFAEVISVTIILEIRMSIRLKRSPYWKYSNSTLGKFFRRPCQKFCYHSRKSN